MNRTGVASAFNCPVCLGPSQSLVFGLCQHFVCASCLYEPVDKSLRPGYHCCPKIWASDKEEHEKSCITKRSSARCGGSPASASTSQRPTTRQSK
ncbi:hypothetical protein MRX96_015871 [Rhipicephalus microplus]